MFCETGDNPMRAKFREAFINTVDGFVYAMDAYNLLIIDRSLVEGEYRKDTLSLPDWGAFDGDRVVRFDAIRKACEGIARVPEMVYPDGTDDKGCTECGGTGYVDWEYTDLDGYTYHRESECPVCDGCGERKADMIPTGRMVLPKHSAFKMDGVLFDAGRMMKCIGALALLGFESMVWKKADAKSPNVFVPAEGVKFVLMPVMDGLLEPVADVEL